MMQHFDNRAGACNHIMGKGILLYIRFMVSFRGFVIGHQVKLLFETIISAFKVVNTLLFCVGCALLFFGNIG